MWTVINSILTSMHDLLDYMRATNIATWGGYTVTFYSAAVSLLVFERIISVFFAAVARFGENGVNDDD